MFEIQFRAMGSEILVVMDSEKDAAREALQWVPIWFENWEQSLSRFREDSELTRVNQSEGRWIAVSETFWNVLEVARVGYLQSGGLVSPMLLRELQGMGYTSSFDELLKDENNKEFWLPTPGSGSQNWEIGMQPEGRLMQLPSEIRLDFGGFAKGWAAQECMQRLAALGPVLVNAGGDISISEAARGETEWQVGVESAFEGGEELLSVRLASRGMATSGKDKRRWRQGDEARHHIIDPRSARPAESNVLRCTVIAPDVLQAEMAAKLVLILGAEEGLAWLDDRGEISGLLIMEDGELRYSNQFEEMTTKELSR